MALWRGCEIPEALFYDVERDVWLRPEPNGDVTLEMTDPAQARCGKIVHIHFKRAGRHLERGKSAATIESAKWAGPFPTPISGTIVAGNQESFRNDILVANRDPYGAGWIVRLTPDDWDRESPGLLSGTEAVERYRERVDRLGITCMRCAD